VSENIPRQRMLYVRYSRDVILTENVEDFRAAVDEAARESFGDKSSVLKRTQSKRPAIKPRHIAGYTGSAIGIQAARIYPVEDWRFDHFEALSPAGDPRSKVLRRLSSASEKIIKKVALTDEELVVNCKTVQFQPQPGYERLGEEIVLPIDLHGDGIVLDEQNDLLSRQSYLLGHTVRQTGPGSDLTMPLETPTQLGFSIGRLPKYDIEQFAEYTERKDQLAAQIGQYLPLLGVELDSVRVRSSF
jgi:hypothetical protein